MHASSYFIEYLMEKYAYILDSLKEEDEYLQILWSNPESSNHRPI